MKTLRAFVGDISGATSIEYGMIGVLISVAILAALTSVSGSTKDLYALIGAL